jgi:FxsC-like protein
VPPSLCLVDAWVSLSAKYQEHLSRLDQIKEPWVSVLVPWNSEDTGMHEARDDLREKLHQHLGRKLAGVPRRCQMAASGIPTLQDFGHLLPEMTMIMLKRFRKEAAAHPPAGPIIERPRLRSTDPKDPGDTR